jgi:hypothetical protein
VIKRLLKSIMPWAIRVALSEYKNSLLDADLLARINKYFEKNDKDKEKYKRELELLNTTKTVNVFPYSFVYKYNAKDILVTKDKKSGLSYVLHNNRKLYFPKGISKRDIQQIYSSLLVEQDNNSPHKYLTETFNISDKDIFVDVGSAEGILSLDLVDKAKAVYLFEYEERWIEALEATFAPWKDKVTIVKKYVSDKVSEHETTIDSYFREFQENLLIKIDVEGAESSVLSGATETLKKDNVKIICCTYHKQEDAEKFEMLLNRLGYKTEFSNGYMLWKYCKELKPPFFRKGLIRAWKEVV